MHKFLLPNVRDRRLEPELMDQSDIDSHRLITALRGLERLNTASGSTAILWRAIRKYAARKQRTNFRILDIACGAGDVTLGLWRQMRRAGWTAEISGCDLNPRSMEYAAGKATVVGAAVRFFCLDATRDPLPECDIVVSSLFLHHLNESDVVQLLAKMADAARCLVLVNDLARSRRGYLLAVAACRLLSRSAVVHADGPQSVAAAFTPIEVLTLARRAGLHTARVSSQWPCRFLLSVERA